MKLSKVMLVLAIIGNFIVFLSGIEDKNLLLIIAPILLICIYLYELMHTKINKESAQKNEK
ncbi:hypothetical protein BAU15_09695 [Enterococcus sp. JM4C]|uniref:hypothetical protein n=1 Tax=Candidatus Enterococcus huntleyi TaxID=1857217 RepID=UPI00137A5EDF|nr:hypothetical protein [Enterococcus sp. JM4C]KAF1298111.1 hypothetical protein BAU15_09695 [Enterococcus sp. JM4C]